MDVVTSFDSDNSDAHAGTPQDSYKRRSENDEINDEIAVGEIVFSAKQEEDETPRQRKTRHIPPFIQYIIILLIVLLFSAYTTNKFQELIQTCTQALVKKEVDSLINVLNNRLTQDNI